MLDRYHLEHELGTGARGAVYRARDRETGRVVAIKLMADPPAQPPVRKSVRGSSRMAAIDVLAHLTHPHIPKVYETARAGHLWFVVMDCATGADLRAHAQPATLLPLSMSLSIMARVANALQHVHGCGLVHGDVKPANIVFDAPTDRVNLTDFTFDCVAGGTSSGTPAYMAPEQLCGMPTSEASDQFSFAVTLYQLACGHLPFGGRSRPEITYRIVNEPHRDIRVPLSSLPSSLAAILDKALAKDARARYPSMGVLENAIRRLAAQVRVASGRESSRLRAHEVCAP